MIYKAWLIQEFDAGKKLDKPIPIEVYDHVRDRYWGTYAIFMYEDKDTHDDKIHEAGLHQIRVRQQRLDFSKGYTTWIDIPLKD